MKRQENSILTLSECLCWYWGCNGLETKVPFTWWVLVTIVVAVVDNNNHFETHLSIFWTHQVRKRFCMCGTCRLKWYLQHQLMLPLSALLTLLERLLNWFFRYSALGAVMPTSNHVSKTLLKGFIAAGEGWTHWVLPSQFLQYVQF